jgi:D-alanyl-lipoteichoic acid acyltransferase DltB (MBOAT superfamily)
MVFNSLHFLAFFVLVYAVYRALPHRGQNVFLLAASYYFYGVWDWRFLSLLWGSTIIDYTCARAIARTEDPGRRRAWLILSLAFNLGMLGFFKYFNFFAGSLQDLFAALGWRLDTGTLHVILPIGISFYTFMTISYVVDVYRRVWTPTDNLLDFALYVAYFPHLVAGPILRAKKLLPQIQAPRTITPAQIREGLWLIAWGYFQKVYVADNLARVTEGVFGAGMHPTGLEVLLGLYAFAFQIFGDFAGYSNIARGTSKLMGIELSINFLYPYFVLSPREFWRNWHISLSEWLRDYLYIPLGGNRGGEWRIRRNLMITMALGGLWHGAAWTFVLWGVYQGAVLVAGRWIETTAERAGLVLRAGLTPARIALGLLMFHVTCYGWLVFRAGSMAQIGELTRALALDWRGGDNAWLCATSLFTYALPLLMVHAWEARRSDLLAVLEQPAAWRYSLYAAVFYLTLLFGDFGGSEFIYFQF